MRREFFLQDDQSNKFWTIEVVGTDVVSTNGRIGAKPRETRATYPSVEAAESAAGKDVLGKRRKGYIEGNLANVPEYVDGLPPRFVRINHDDYHAKFVGKVHDGSQFFLTHPFAQSLGDRPGANFMALYIFDEFGLLTDARIEQLKIPKERFQSDLQPFEFACRLSHFRNSNTRKLKLGSEWGLQGRTSCPSNVYWASQHASHTAAMRFPLKQL